MTKRIIIATVFGLFSTLTQAASGYLLFAPFEQVFELNKTLTAAQNSTGATTEGNVSSSGSYKNICIDSDGNSLDGVEYIYADTLLPIVINTSTFKYVKASNDYLYFGASRALNGTTHYFPTNGKEKWVTDYGHTCNVTSRSVSQQRVSVYVAKPFIGSMTINEKRMFRVSIGAGPAFTGAQDQTSYYVDFSGSITVPQSCEVQPGNTFEIDLGDIPQNAFVRGGAGNRPAGFTSRPLTAKVQCSGGVQADALINVRLEGPAAANYPQALTSDNADIGVVITKADGSTILMPNDLNSIIPMPLTTGQGTVTIQAYPISLTGKTPAVGLFTSLAYLRFDFS
jgi:P pilus assembly protein, pilin FimA